MRFLRSSGSFRMWALVCPLVAACGGSASTLNGGPDGGGGGASSGSGSGGSSGSGSSSGASSSSSGSSGSGSSSGSTSSSGTSGDSGTGDGAVACSPLTAGAKDVFVDQRFTGSMPTGTHACPFTTILAGLKAAASLNGTITVHVAGSTPALVYMESTSVAVASNIVLQGDGPNHTTISASGMCGNVSLLCAVTIAGGGTVDGFTVTSPGGDGIVAAAASTAPVISNVDPKATGSSPSAGSRSAPTRRSTATDRTVSSHLRARPESSTSRARATRSARTWATAST
jgi:hypothetical protein